MISVFAEVCRWQVKAVITQICKEQVQSIVQLRRILSMSLISNYR